jgi:hypothetical protein
MTALGLLAWAWAAAAGRRRRRLGAAFATAPEPTPESTPLRVGDGAVTASSATGALGDQASTEAVNSLPAPATSVTVSNARKAHT